MRVARLFCVAAALCAALSAPASGAQLRLTIDAATERATRFAERTCRHDESCVRHGVLNCRRERPRVVLCRIFDQRDTEAQGRYRCDRMIRIALDAKTRRTPVTGLGPWHC